MLYCHSQEEQRLLGTLSLPIPRSLLSLLFKRGLGIWVIPSGIKGQKLLYKHLGIKCVQHSPDGRWPHEFNAYYPEQKRIIIHSWALRHYKVSNVLIHELGHAFDYLMFPNGYCISDYPLYRKYLKFTKSLDEHTKTQDSYHKRMAEHFATCFEAYLREPKDMLGEGHKNIRDLHPKTVKFYQRILAPFYEEDRKNKEGKKDTQERIILLGN